MPLPAADLAALSRLLDEALELDAPEREAWLAGLPEAQHHLVPALRGMLTARGSASTFLGALPSIREAEPPSDHGAARAGEVVGPYRLIREIGHGGMGTVWLAERADGAFKRQIALKLPRLTWAPGLAKRMAREREIGAMLEHPNIARLYDAGVDKQGRPYLAMEYIDGVPIDLWCLDKQLHVRGKLRLMEQVARAVAYAHGRLVAHRDLKPSNVLVSADGQVHLLDFGIAKLLDEDPSGHTQDLARPFTLHYASPEQLRGDAVTVQSDVYSLGVVVYELLTGQVPHAPKCPTPDLLQAAIQHAEPAAPSLRLHDGAARRSVRGDVDAIVLQALHVDPDRRYASAEALAEDICRWLRGDTVAARPESPMQRLRKVLRRHRLVSGVGAGLCSALLATGVFSWWQAERAARAYERERIVTVYVGNLFRESARATLSTEFPSSAHVMIDVGARAVEAALVTEPQLQADIYAAVSQAYSEMGAHARAARYAQMRIDSLAAAGGPAAERAAALVQLAQALLDDGRFDDAVEKAIDARMTAGSDPPLRLQAQVVAARAWQLMGVDVQAQQALREADHWRVPQTSEARIASAWSHVVRANLLLRQDRLDEAKAAFNRGIAEATYVEGATSLQAALMRLDAANALAHTAVAGEALRHHQEATERMSRFGGEHRIRALIESVRFASERHRGGLQASVQESLVAAERSRAELDVTAKTLPLEVFARLDFWEARIRLGEGDVANALRLLDRSAPVLLASTGAGLARAEVAGSYGCALLRSDRRDEAIRWLQEAMFLVRKAGVAQRPCDGQGFSAGSVHNQ